MRCCISNKLYFWSTNTLLRLHPDKYYAINIHNKSKHYCHHNYKMKNKDLENKSETEDLELIVDENLCF